MGMVVTIISSVMTVTVFSACGYVPPLLLTALSKPPTGRVGNELQKVHILSCAVKIIGLMGELSRDTSPSIE